VPPAIPIGLEDYLAALMERSLHDALIFSERIAKATSVMSEAGMTADAISIALNEDLLRGGKIFGELSNSIKSGINEGVNQSGRLGQAEQYPPGEKNYSWVTVAGHKVCPDCDARTGDVRTWDEWVGEGLPGSGWSICGGHCYCVLDPVGKWDSRIEGTPPAVKEPGASLPRIPKDPATKIGATERIKKFISTPNGRWAERLVEKHGSFSFPGVSEKHLEIIARALEDTLGRFNLNVHHLGTFKTGWPRFRARGANGAAWGSPKLQNNAIGWKKTYIKGYRATSKNTRRAFESIRQREIISAKETIERYEKLALKGDRMAEGWVRKAKADLKRLTDKRYNKWSTSSAADDALYATSKHESWHQVDFQLRLDGKAICGKEFGNGGIFKRQLDKLKVPRDDWYFVSEYAGSSIFELWAEVGTALDLGMYVPPNIKKAFIASIKEAGFTYP